jgi:hypothetical protein
MVHTFSLFFFATFVLHFFRCFAALRFPTTFNRVYFQVTLMLFFSRCAFFFVYFVFSLSWSVRAPSFMASPRGQVPWKPRFKCHLIPQLCTLIATVVPSYSPPSPNPPVKTLFSFLLAASTLLDPACLFRTEVEKLMLTPALNNHNSSAICPLVFSLLRDTTRRKPPSLDGLVLISRKVDLDSLLTNIAFTDRSALQALLVGIGSNLAATNSSVLDLWTRESSLAPDRGKVFWVNRPTPPPVSASLLASYLLMDLSSTAYGKIPEVTLAGQLAADADAPFSVVSCVFCCFFLLYPSF